MIKQERRREVRHNNGVSIKQFLFSIVGLSVAVSVLSFRFIANGGGSGGSFIAVEAFSVIPIPHASFTKNYHHHYASNCYLQRRIFHSSSTTRPMREITQRNLFPSRKRKNNSIELELEQKEEEKNKQEASNSDSDIPMVDDPTTPDHDQHDDFNDNDSNQIHGDDDNTDSTEKIAPTSSKEQETLSTIETPDPPQRRRLNPFPSILNRKKQKAEGGEDTEEMTADTSSSAIQRSTNKNKNKSNDNQKQQQDEEEEQKRGGVLQSLSNLNQSSRKTVSSAAGAVASGVNQFATQSTSNVQSVAKAAGSTVSSAAGAVASGVNQVATQSTSVAKAAGSTVSSAAGAVATGVNQLATQSTSNVQSVAQAAGSTVSSAAGAVASGVNQFATQSTSNVQSVAQAAGSTVSSAAGAVASGVNQLATQSTSNVQSVAQAAGSSINDATLGFVNLARDGTSAAGNLVSWLDTQAKDSVNATNAKTQEMVLGFTGKDTYQFGDISKEVLRRASTTDVEIRDVMLVLKVLLTMGAAITPLAKILPLTVLIEMLNVSLEARLGGKILEAVGSALDERLLAAFSAEELGDAVKRSMALAIAAFTGKDNFSKGDIEKAVKEEMEKEKKEKTKKQQREIDNDEEESNDAKSNHDEEQSTTSSPAVPNDTASIIAEENLTTTTTNDEIPKEDEASSPTLSSNEEILHQESDEIFKEKMTLDEVLNTENMHSTSSSRSTPSSYQEPATTTTLNLMVGREFEEWDQAFLSKYDSKDMDTVVAETLNSSSSSSIISTSSSNSNVVGMTTTAISSEEKLDRRFVNELDDLMVRQEFAEWDDAFIKQFHSTADVESK